MIKEIQYTNIRRVLDNLMEHPLLRDITLEQVVRYVIRFISLHGYPKMFQDKLCKVDIHEYRGLMPCDLISIIQVKDLKTGLCIRAMTDTFQEGIEPKDYRLNPIRDLTNNVKDLYIPPRTDYREEATFKTQGRVIYTSFPKGCLEIAYKSIPTDDDGYPLLIDNENYLAALEAYIKVQIFTIKFDTGKIGANVLQNAQQEYAFLAGELSEEFNQPSYSEAESIARMWNTLILPVRHFDNGYKNLGDREWLRKH